MSVEQLYTKCLAQGAYFISSEREAAVIDPIREPDSYLMLAQQKGCTIKYIFETHFHADFVSGHLELAALTGATIVYGPTAVTAFDAHIGRDEETFRIGKLRLKLLHTPGHTLESCCYLLEGDDSSAPVIFTGDTLFIGDVGRPDLAQQPVSGLTRERLAGMLYDSIREKIMPLDDRTFVYPGHGAGSACGKNISTQTWDTLANQKISNYALDSTLSKDQFVKDLITGLSLPPAYFPINVRLNSQGYKELKHIRNAVNPLTAEAFAAAAQMEDTVILDTRDAADFAAVHIPGAVNIGLNGSFATWAGALLPLEGSVMLIIAEEGKEDEVITRLARVGFDNVTGYLSGGMSTWNREVKHIPNISAHEFMYTAPKDLDIIDVRTPAEFAKGHVHGARNLSLNDFHHRKDAPNQRAAYVYCAGGYRSMIYISLLAKAGHQLVNIDGGYAAIQSTNEHLNR